MNKLALVFIIALFSLCGCTIFSNGKIVETGTCETTPWDHLYKNETTPSSSKIVLVNTSATKKFEFTVKEYKVYSDCEYGDCKNDDNFVFRSQDEDTDIIELNPGEEKVLDCKVEYLTYQTQINPPFARLERKYEIVGEREVK
jgi:hypothetical protein